MGDVQTAASRPLWALLLLLLLALLVHGEPEGEGGRVLWSGSREMAGRTEQVVCNAMQCDGSSGGGWVGSSQVVFVIDAMLL